MLKLIGILLIVSATTKIGFALAARLERRKNSLLCFKDALSLLESEIGFAQNSLARACENIGNTLSPPAGAFFLDVHDALSRGIDTQQAWEELLGKYRQTLCLTAADIQLLRSFAARLGRSDVENELKNIYNTTVSQHMRYEQKGLSERGGALRRADCRTFDLGGESDGS